MDATKNSTFIMHTASMDLYTTYSVFIYFRVNWQRLIEGNEWELVLASRVIPMCLSHVLYSCAHFLHYLYFLQNKQIITKYSKHWLYDKTRGMTIFFFCSFQSKSVRGMNTIYSSSLTLVLALSHYRIRAQQPNKCEKQYDLLYTCKLFATRTTTKWSTAIIIRF